MKFTCKNAAVCPEYELNKGTWYNNIHSLRDDQQAVSLTNGVNGCHSMRLECLSCSPVRRKGCGRDRTNLNQPARDCGHAYCSLLTPDTAAWGENSDSGQGTYSQPTGKGTNELEAPHTNHNLEDCETDQDDTSAFDYSSVTSCSPDGTLRREMMGSNSGEDEEEDSQVPVLLKPSYNQQQQSREAPRERTVCLRWQIPRLTPHPPLRNTAGPCVDGPTPCLVSSYGKRLVSVRKGSPPLHPKSAFRPIWDDPSKQVFTVLSITWALCSVHTWPTVGVLDYQHPLKIVQNDIMPVRCLEGTWSNLIWLKTSRKRTQLHFMKFSVSQWVVSNTLKPLLFVSTSLDVPERFNPRKRQQTRIHTDSSSSKAKLSEFQPKQRKSEVRVFIQ